jgi:hypothetical protein
MDELYTTHQSVLDNPAALAVFFAAKKKIFLQLSS